MVRHARVSHRPSKVARVHAKDKPVGSSTSSDIKALNSSIMLISQKMKYLVRNEKILGRNLIVLNKKLKRIDEKMDSGTLGGMSLEDMAGINKSIRKMSERLALIEAQISEIRENYAMSEQLQELKYVIDSINPLEFVTLDQVNKLIDEKTGKK